jgi:hypothetical protein
MTTTTADRTGAVTGSRSTPATLRVVRALAAVEARRLVRNPALLLGAAFSTWFLWSVDPRTEDWSGSSYEGMAMASVALMWSISVSAALAFQRERVPVALDAPVPEVVRAVARLVAMVPLVALAGAFAALVAWRQRDLGGLPLGEEPGRTLDALQTLPELLQHVALAVLAVALGAALGRRMGRLAAVVPLMFLVWYLAGAFYWLFGSSAVMPFSLVQVQPAVVVAGPADTDPLTFPQEWLLNAPNEYQDWWGRLFVSDTLAWWHDAWVLGLALLLLAAAVPAGRLRRCLLVGGLLVAVVAAVVQVRVIP